MRTKKVKCVLLALVVFGVLTACSERYATPTADERICVYDGSERGGQKLKLQLGPGENAKEIDDNDIVVKIPANNRFFFASKNDTLRDPNAPLFYETFAAKNVSVQIEGQDRFRFNDNACDWFSKHGRRNAIDGKDMQFNARGGDAANSPWLHWLAENFGPAMQQAVNQVTSSFDAFALVFHYPSNAGEDGTLPDGTTPAETADVALGKAIGPVFTKILTANLGGEFFCGIDPVDADLCPDLTFQVTAVHTTIPGDETARQEVETLRQQLISAQLKGALQQQTLDAIQSSAAAESAILEQQAAAARKKQEADPYVARCILFAERGLDCDGKRPPVIVNGQPAG